MRPAQDLPQALVDEFVGVAHGDFARPERGADVGGREHFRGSGASTGRFGQASGATGSLPKSAFSGASRLATLSIGPHSPAAIGAPSVAIASPLSTLNSPLAPSIGYAEIRATVADCGAAVD